MRRSRDLVIGNHQITKSRNAPISLSQDARRAGAFVGACAWRACGKTFHTESMNWQTAGDASPLRQATQKSSVASGSATGTTATPLAACGEVSGMPMHRYAPLPWATIIRPAWLYGPASGVGTVRGDSPSRANRSSTLSYRYGMM